MSFKFELAIYNPEGQPRHIAVSEYLEKYELGQIIWTPDIDSTTIIFIFENSLYIAPHWNLGRCEWLIPQLEAAAERLRNNVTALIRSAVIDGAEVPYISFEPSDDDVLVSLFIIPDEKVEKIFPAGPWSEESDYLYNYFNEHRDALLNRITDPYLLEISENEYFSRLKVPRELMIDSLVKEIKIGQKLVRILES